jgi:peptidoglycan/xylan/chitin deacetylase (PgdA/CDA1 family)
MRLAGPFWQKVERHLARYCACRTVHLKYDTGVVCFTFDDVRRTACDHGAAILERYGVRGTFYVSGGLTGICNNHTRADLLRIAKGDHELGCHGFGHLSYQSISKLEILSDIKKNRSFLEDIGFGAPQNFAYPYGHVNTFAKRIVACKFVSARGIHAGINYPAADLALLKSFPLYEHRWDRTSLARLLEENAKLRGLLVFFAHGISRDPGQFDCSIELMDFVVRLSIASGNKVTPVRDALEALARPERPRDELVRYSGLPR